MAGWAAELCTGERVVVFLFVARVLCSAPLPLFVYEAFALAVLAAASLAAEIAAESSPALHRFKTRPGVSSGILLGAITLPTVILSRMIQFSRTLPGHDFGREDVGHMSMQFWAVSMGSFGVLIFLYLLLQHLRQEARPTCLWSYQPSKYSFLYITSYAFACYLSLAANFYSGWIAIVRLIWLVCHGAATVMLIQHVLRTFPSCASIGEALLVSSGLVLYFGDMLEHTLAKIHLFSSELNFNGHKLQNEVESVIQGMMVGLLAFPVFYNAVLRGWQTLMSFKKHEVVVDRTIERAVVFYSSLLVMLTVLVPAWMYLIQDFRVHPVLWFFMFVFTDPFKRLALCIYWIVVICASVFQFYNIAKHSKTERILLRKYYHLVAVLMFCPAVLFQPTFLDLAFGTALAVFLVLEMMRVWKVWPLGHIIHQFMNAFTDHRDSEILIVSHFSLLLGCALPKWLSSGFSDRPLTSFAGILSLGIGDTMASVVGHKYGVLRWSKTGKKTVEGTAAGITSVLAACSILLPLLASTGYLLSQHWASLLVAVTISGLLEAYTAQLDNAFIPLVFYSLLCL